MPLPRLDSNGFLENNNDWSEQVCHELAAMEQITLTAEHFEIIHLVQQFYKDFDHPPSQRPMSKYVKLNLGPEKAASIYLMKLFGSSPAKIACKLAGLPKPPNCL